MGELSEMYAPGHHNGIISDLYPGNRLGNVGSEDGISYQEIEDDIVYFDVMLPRLYKTIDVEIIYRNPNPILELGALIDKDEWVFKIETIENNLIDGLNWDVVSDENSILLQKEKEYESVADFYSNPPPGYRIATYQNDIVNKNLKIADYEPSSELKTYEVSLQGSHTLYTYIKNEQLYYEIDLIKFNNENDNDQVSFVITNARNGEEIMSEIVYLNDSSKLISPNIISLNDLEESIYRIDILCDENITINEISTRQNKSVIQSKLKMIRLDSAVSEIYFAGNTLNAMVYGLNDLQSIKINDKSVNLEVPSEKYIIEKSYLDRKNNLIVLENNNIEFSSDGYFGFSEASMFMPKAENLSNNTDFERVEYIISKKYKKPSKEGDGWGKGVVSFNLNEINPAGKKLIQFIINNPGNRLSENKLEISEIRTVLKRDPITFKTLKNKMNSIF